MGNTSWKHGFDRLITYPFFGLSYIGFSATIERLQQSYQMIKITPRFSHKKGDKM